MELLDPKILDRIGNYALLSKHVVEGFITGLHRSLFHGFGSEFVQYRNYAPGDDLKYLDWKVYARTNQLCTKVFREETNMTCRIVLDCSESMSYKGQNSPLSKLDYASVAASCLAYLASGQGDKVGFYAYGEDIYSAVPPGSSQRHLQDIFREMNKLKATGKGQHRKCLTKISDGFKGRGLVLFISDMLESEDEIIQFLKAMRFSNNDCILMQILDKDELELPFEHNVRFVSMEENGELLTAPELIRGNYQNKLNAHVDKIKISCRQNLIDFEVIDTSRSLDYVLASYLHKRQEIR